MNGESRRVAREFVDKFRGFNVQRADEPIAQCSDNNHKLVPEDTYWSGTLAMLHIGKSVLHRPGRGVSSREMVVNDQ